MRDKTEEITQACALVIKAYDEYREAQRKHDEFLPHGLGSVKVQSDWTEHQLTEDIQEAREDLDTAIKRLKNLLDTNEKYVMP